MGMTIDEAIHDTEVMKEYLECRGEIRSEGLGVAIGIMRRYQQIQEIVKQKDYDRFNSRNYYGYFLRVQDIRKVIEDGNDK